MSDLASKLCVQCGLCCDGTFFEDIELENDDELDRCEDLGLRVDDSQAEPLLLQPCNALEECQCSVYAYRPQCCRTFRCHLLNELECSKISFERALSIVFDLKEKRSELLRLIPERHNKNTSSSLRSKILEFMEEASEKSFDSCNELHNKTESLNNLIKKNFIK